MTEDVDLRDFGNVCRLFPLPGVVLLPHAILPLHIFEPRYRQMTEDALAGDRLVAMVQLLPGVGASDPGRPPIERVACLGRIVRHERLPDGRFNYLLLGRKRVRILRELASDRLYREAEVEVLEDREPEGADPDRRAELVRLFGRVAEAEGPVDPDLARLLGSDAPLGVLADLLAHALGLPPAIKQGFLAEPRVDLRCEGLIEILRRLDVPPGRRYPPPIHLN